MRRTGLGLNTVLHYVTSMQGTIQLESEVNKGSTFTVELPLEVVMEEESNNTQHSPEVDQCIQRQIDIQENYLNLFGKVKMSPIANTNSKIIIADDNPINRKVICKLIESLGYEVDQVCNGKELIEKVDDKKHKLIITDLVSSRINLSIINYFKNMPILDGREAAKIIKSRFRNIKIIALTGDVLVGPPSTSFDAVITKPCPKNVLQECIELHCK